MPTRTVTVGTTATPLLYYNNRRTTASFLNNGGETIFVSNDQSNIQGNGFPIGVGGALDLVRALGDEPHIQWYAESAGGGDDMRVLEGYGALPLLYTPPNRESVTGLEEGRV